MRALLLSAGFGTRLRPLTESVPKCLIPINGKPLMEYWLDMLCREKNIPVMVNLHYLSKQVEDYIAISPYKQFVTTVFEEYLLGTGGTLLRNRNFFGKESVFMAHGDNLSLFDLTAFVRAHYERPGHCEMTMMTFETDTPQSCGIVELDTDNVVCAFHEKVDNPPGNLANGAVYILEPSVLDFLDSLGKEVIDFSTEVLPYYVGRINAFHNGRYHRDIGTMDSYRKAQNDFFQPDLSAIKDIHFEF
ncbi:nucleotidyltransferase family protein [Desulfobacula phenolica]|uniref:Mannose-1-phosphate guanylyltransferase n=1 Tax=Desulfobacula phenolica TaxID=90732 RepID=A0A1H2DRI8_9BACT|nr:nucleotidyltransferase family protein [Desulfobacula phenolica]SDT85492.1 mannose-1-phosphate guanylyltransferase [Desulfobacula phenolica]